VDALGGKLRTLTSLAENSKQDNQPKSLIFSLTPSMQDKIWKFSNTMFCEQKYFKIVNR
jgi:hypothetical protein